MSTGTLERDPRTAFDDLLTGGTNTFASLDSTYDRGFRAGTAQALRDHLGLILAAAQHQVAVRPHEREAVASFVSVLQKALVPDDDGDSAPFEYDGGLGI